MAAKKHMPTFRDAEALKELVKAHITTNPCKCQRSWQYKDMEDVVENYQDFLTKIAERGCRLSKVMLAKALQDHFEGDLKLLRDFSAQMADALSHCKKSMKSVSSGSKTGQGVLRVQRAFAKALSTTTSPASEAPTLHTQGSRSFSEPESPLEVNSETSEGEPDQGSAETALEQARKLFGGPAGKKTLARHDSAVSVKSSEACSPKGAVQEQKQKVDLGQPPTHNMRALPSSAHMGATAPI